MIFNKGSDKEDKPTQPENGDASAQAQNKPAADAAGQAEFGIKGIFVRDLSYEAPHMPEADVKDWKPEVKFELNTQARKIENTTDDYEVILKINVTVKHDKKVCFLAEVQQGGSFTLRGFDDQQRGHMLGSFCPNVLYPYARELMSKLASRGGYPPLYLAPVNFDALYMEHLNRLQQGQAEKSSSPEAAKAAE